MNNKPIGVFDSGIGGIMVLNQLVKKMPYEKYVYLGDNKHFPYGEKTKEEIIEYTRQNIKILLKNCENEYNCMWYSYKSSIRYSQK